MVVVPDVAFLRFLLLLTTDRRLITTRVAVLAATTASGDTTEALFSAIESKASPATNQMEVFWTVSVKQRMLVSESLVDRRS